MVTGELESGYDSRIRCRRVVGVAVVPRGGDPRGGPGLLDNGVPAMKLLPVVLFVSAAFGQNPPILTWKDTINPAATTYTVYRAPTPCSPTPPIYAAIGAGITSKSFTDASPLSPGTYAYAVSATVGKREGAKSVCVEISIPAPPTDLLIALGGRRIVIVGTLTSDSRQPCGLAPTVGRLVPVVPAALGPNGQPAMHPDLGPVANCIESN